VRFVSKIELDVGSYRNACPPLWSICLLFTHSTSTYNNHSPWFSILLVGDISCSSPNNATDDVHAETAASHSQSKAFSTKSDRSFENTDIQGAAEEIVPAYPRDSAELSAESKSVHSKKSCTSTQSVGHSHNSEKNFKSSPEDGTFAWQYGGTTCSYDGTRPKSLHSIGQEMYGLRNLSVGNSDAAPVFYACTLDSASDQQHSQRPSTEPSLRQETESTSYSADHVEQQDRETAFYERVLKGRMEKQNPSLKQRFESRSRRERMVIVGSVLAAVAAFAAFVVLVSLAPKGGSKKLERGSFTGGITVIWLSIGTGMWAGGRSAVEILMAMTMSLCYGIFLTGQIDVFKT
jgi:hypothetical protein